VTEPKRLLESADGECDAFEADLLRAGRGDAMSAASKRALVAAALGGTLTVSAGATAAAHAATAAKVSTSVFAKWMVIGVVGAAFAVSAGVLLARSPAPVTTTLPPPVVEPRAESVLPPSTPVPSAPPLAPLLAAAATDADPERLAPRVATVTSAARPPVASAEDDLAAEAAVLEEAREAVARRDGAAAVVALNEHARRFPRPALADEAFVLRAEALAAQGEGARLRALAAPWLANHPTSPYASRVRRAVAQASPAPSGGATP
jgi:hypothetical protein